MGRAGQDMVSLRALAGASSIIIAVAASASTVENWCSSVAAVLATALVLVSLNYLLWRIWVSSRARRKAAGGGCVGRLPAPVPVLPAWCGFLGGHSLIMKPSKVCFGRLFIVIYFCSIWHQNIKYLL